jgi:hypothetical protein
MNCCNSEFRRLMERFLYGRLDSKDTEKFQDHLFDCPGCRQMFLEECMLKEFTRKYSLQLISKPIDTTIWNVMRAILEETKSAFLTPAFPVHFRNSVQTLNVRKVLYTMNFTGNAELCPVNPLFSIKGDCLNIEGIKADKTDYDIYLMVCSKDDLQALRSIESRGIQSLVNYLALKISMNTKMDSNVKQIIERSIVIEGHFATKEPDNGDRPQTVFSLPELAVFYVMSSDYIPILILR